MTNIASDIQKIYIAYFGRPADPIGLDYWMQQNFSLTQIADSFAQQAEYKRDFDGHTIETTLKLIYKNLFVHDADVNGLAYWSGQINSGIFSLGQAALAIANGAIGVDAITLASKNMAATSFTAALTTVEQQIIYNILVRSTYNYCKEWLSLVSNPDTASLLTGYIPAITTAMVNSGGNGGRDLIDVLGLDLAQGTHFAKGNVSIAGGPGDDVIRITDAQYDMGTTIDGGAGADTLDLGILTSSRSLYRVSNIETITVTGGNADWFTNEDGAGVTLNFTKGATTYVRGLQLGSGGQTLNLLGTGTGNVSIIGSTAADTIKLSAVAAGVDSIVAKGSLLGDGTPDTVFNFKAAGADVFRTGVQATSLNNVTIAAADTAQLASLINEAAASAGIPLNAASQALYITIKTGTAAGNYAFENIGNNLSAVDAGDFIVKLVGNGSIVVTDFVV
ncbi:DUF4214 domain-containing protein [Undibacterium sp. Ji83W]|uniref:DUF4214 domain-containing protein n=1 Tax=Undibacterium sp. Ji83W TaxID=3413043 RepID=UPI003BF1F266